MVIYLLLKKLAIAKILVSQDTDELSQGKLEMAAKIRKSILVDN